MASQNEAPTWADQWGSSVSAPAENEERSSGTTSNKKTGSSTNAKLIKVKSMAATGFDKAKAATIFGAAKVKSGTTAGIKWVKAQYQKRKSK